MVENNVYLDDLFGSLANTTRRDILRRLTTAQYTVGQIADHYEMSLAAVAKHLAILQKAKLVIKKKQGTQQLVSIAPEALKDVSRYIAQFEALWNYRFDALDKVLKEEL
jgi:DNA-binding transcriptional ArsR family regulator